MIPRMSMPRGRAIVVVTVIAALAGCGSSLRAPSAAHEHAVADLAVPGHLAARPSARGRQALAPSAGGTPGSCAAAVLEALGDVAMRIYNEGVFSSRTESAIHLVTTSIPLREAVERGEARAARAAAQALLATGHLTDLQVSREGTPAGAASAKPAAGGRTLAEAGASGALAPLRGTLTGARGSPIGSYVASVWADSGLIADTDGIAEGVTVLRAHGRSVAGSLALPPGELPAQGTLKSKGLTYQYTSFPAESYPSGSVRVYLLRSVRSTAGLCGPTSQDTEVNTISRVATVIYGGEVGPRALTQVHRVQHDQALLGAVARGDPAATRAAIDALLNEHIVRLRVSAGGRLLADVGGPFVLAPVDGSLRQGGHTIGSFVLSIQDDLGYLLLAQRLAGLEVLMYRGSKLVMSSFRPVPAGLPSTGPFQSGGRTYRAFTFNAQAFPSGALRITVLIPVPYAPATLVP
jgi:hypothetical protein